MTGRKLLKELNLIGNSQSNTSDLNLPQVTIILLTWNNLAVTIDCLQSLEKLVYPNYRIYLIDNNSTDETVEVVHRQFPECSVITNPTNLGFAGGANIGIRRAIQDGAEFVLLLNNDTLVPPDMINILVSNAQTHDERGIFMPKIRIASGDQVEWFIGSRQHWLTLDAQDFSPSGMRNNNNLVDSQVDFIFGTAMFIRTDVFAKIGLLDEDYFLYYEDMDFCNRARRAGIGLQIVPETSVRHHVSASTNDQEPFRYYHKARSSVIYYRKHVSGLRWAVILPYRLVSAMLTILRLIQQGHRQSIVAFLRGLNDGRHVRLGRFVTGTALNETV